MSLQARLSQTDPRLYSPNRDVAHNFPFVVQSVMKRLVERRWAELETLLDASAVPDAALTAASDAFVKFVKTAVDEPKEDMFAALERCGWFAVPPLAQVAYMAYLGTVISGIFFHGAREATLGGEGPCADLRELAAAGERCSRLLALPPWRRFWLRLRWRLQGVLRAMRQTQ